MRIYFIICLGFSVLLSACSTTPKPEMHSSLVSSASPYQKTNDTPAITWEKHQQLITNIKNWNMQAIIALQSPQENGTATMRWQQNEQSYHISLFGPLGTNSVQLTGRPQEVILESSDGKKITAQSPEILLAEQTGWKIPVSNLYYWIRGVPIPTVHANMKYDSQNHLLQLAQQGWMIQYSDYTFINHLAVPTKILLNDSQMRVKIIIKQWKF